MRATLQVVASVVLLSTQVWCWSDDDNEEDEYDVPLVQSKEEQIMSLQLETGEAMKVAAPLLRKLTNLKAEQRAIDNGIIFQGAAAKAMQPRIDEATRNYMEAEYAVDIIRRKIKPLYGVVSVQHLQEHREVIYESFERAIETGKSHMWWDMILGGSSNREDGLEGLLMKMAMSFITGLTFGYVIGFIKFLVMSPFTIYQYTSSVLDIPAALGMWVLGIALFLVPLIALYYSCLIVSKQRAAHARRFPQQAQYRRVQMNRMGGPGY